MIGYHFLPDDLRSEEDLMRGIFAPWLVGETRTCAPLRYLGAAGEAVIQHGYASSPSAWEAFLHNDGVVACLVEVTACVHSELNRGAICNFSRTRTLRATKNIATQLRQFAVRCAEHALVDLNGALLKDSRVQMMLRASKSLNEVEINLSESGRVFMSGLDLATRCTGSSRFAIVVVASASYPQAGDAAHLVMDATRDLLRATGGNAEIEREWQRSAFKDICATLF